MAQDVNVKQTVLQKTLEEVSHDDDHKHAVPCVICLEQVEEVGIALPCKHATFDFICLASWLSERRSCPLCQADVTAVKYDVHSPQGPKIYSLPPPPAPSRDAVPSAAAASAGHQGRPGYRAGLPRRPPPQSRPRPQPPTNDPLARRRQVYRHQLYSQRVGTNRLSQYCEITPRTFSRDENLVSRAQKWIRRELQVFEFLNPDNEPAGDTTGAGGGGDGGSTVRRRASNAEFLLEYIMAILRTVDIKGSGGQAEELLREFIGRENAPLFLHELQAWLRSPYNSLEDWDRSVQYDERGRGLPASQPAQDTVSPQRLTNAGRGRDSYRPRGVRKSRTQQRYPDPSQSRRLQRARDRYIPD